MSKWCSWSAIRRSLCVVSYQQLFRRPTNLLRRRRRQSYRKEMWKPPFSEIHKVRSIPTIWWHLTIRKTARSYAMPKCIGSNFICRIKKSSSSIHRFLQIWLLSYFIEHMSWKSHSSDINLSRMSRLTPPRWTLFNIFSDIIIEHVYWIA